MRDTGRAVRRGVPRRDAAPHCHPQDPDAGRPIVVSRPQSEHAQVFRRMATRLAEKLGGPQRQAPKIVVE